MELMPGYKQTEVGMIPEDWSTARLSALVEKGSPITYGVVKPGSNDLDGVLFIRGGDIFAGRIEERRLRKIPKAVSEQYKRTLLEGGEILVSLVGYPGEAAIVPPHLRGANIARQVALVRLSTQLQIVPDYICKFLQSDLGKRQLLKEAIGSAQQVINLRDIQKVAAVIPPTTSEQRAIAEALSDADALIESLDKLIAKKRQIKQGAMQELLTGKRRLSGFSGEWEVKRLGDFGSTYGGLTGKTKADFGEGSSRYITFMNVMANVVIDCDIFEPVNVSSTESQNRAAKGDLFFNGSSETPEEVGLCSVLADSVADVYLNSFCFGFRFREGAKANGLYFAYFFRSLEGRELLKSLAQGATRYNLSKTALLKVAFPLPSLEEQTAIATVLSDMDTELAALESRLAKARQIKQGMMQELLTGRIRLL
ncbi:restriction endonuclease subunit S [Acidovorax delafieldii]|uniref:restriction endonuclease subunit S n=1 Tax=Acidovorax delafieldii TaxID=47920 RepID=UPI003ECEEAE1